MDRQALEVLSRLAACEQGRTRKSANPRVLLVPAAWSGFGAAGSLVVVLLWVYFSAQILLVGAEFTCVYARRPTSSDQPKEPP